MTPRNMTVDAPDQDKLDQHRKDEKFMAMALDLARESIAHGEVPIGALIVDKNGKILARSANLREKHQTTLGHAELVVIHRACKKLNSWRLLGCTLYVTLEPCFMCAGALVQSRISRVVYGARDPKAGAVESLANLGNDPRLNHKFSVSSGVHGEECGQMLSDFFRQKRTKARS